MVLKALVTRYALHRACWCAAGGSGGGGGGSGVLRAVEAASDTTHHHHQQQRQQAWPHPQQQQQQQQQRRALATGAAGVSAADLDAYDGESEVVIALGSNQGDRVRHIVDGIRALAQHGIQVLRTSLMYETAPAGVTDQPPFINAALLCATRAAPLQLLYALKRVERAAGRAPGGPRWGPRPLDLDVIFYGPRAVDHEALTVPHPRWRERAFVLAPVADLLRPGHRGGSAGGAGGGFDPRGSVLPRLQEAAEAWRAAGGEALVGQPGLCRVLPIARQIWELGSVTHVMGILNATPDSFSDGGAHVDPTAAVAAARAMVRAGAGVIDVGGQSTRPGSQRLGPEEELARVLPVIRALREDSELVHAPVSIDTYHASVAAAAVAAGADVINDVTGGAGDHEMLPTAAALGVPLVAMHMRGTPASAFDASHVDYGGDLVAGVAAELAARADAAAAAGLPLFHLVLDPGLGFSKTQRQSAALLGKLRELRGALPGALARAPMLVGPSRKRFIGSITGRDDPKERDVGTAAACVVAAVQGAEVVRVHNVGMCSEALRVADCVVRGTALARLESTGAALPVHPGRTGER